MYFFFLEIVEEYILYLHAGDRVFALRMIKKKKKNDFDTMTRYLILKGFPVSGHTNSGH